MKRRMEYVPDELDPDTLAVVQAVRALLIAQHNGRLWETVRRAGVLDRTAEHVTNRMMLVAASASDGSPAAHRTIAEAYASGRPGTRAGCRSVPQQHALPPRVQTMGGGQVRAGDHVTDSGGGCLGYGRITSIQRHGARYHATTESGHEQAFLPFDLVTVARSPQEP